MMKMYKKCVLADKEFIESRRRALRRFLIILSRHPSIYQSPMLKFFLTYTGHVRILLYIHLNNANSNSWNSWML